MESIKSTVKAYVVVATIVLLLGVSSAVDVAWIAHHAEGVGLQDQAREGAVDDQGNVYVTGTSYSGSRPDFATVKFDADGNQVWARRYDGPGGDGDEAVAIAVHPSRGVYVTGRSHGESGYKIVAIKYGLDGEELWVKAYPEAPDPAIWGVEPVALAVDPDGTVYITGWGGGQGGVDIVTLAYDSDGSQLWTVFHEDDQGGASPIVVGADGVKVAGIAVGVDGVYVAGTSYNRFITLVYNTDGVKLWSAHHGDPPSTTEDATAIAVDAAGFVYVTGWAYDTRASADYLTVKYDPDGNEVWVARFDGPVGWDLANAIAVGGDGTVFVTGRSESHRR